MKAAVVPSEWLRRDGRRFDAGPYTSGAVEARQLLANLRLRKDRLADLTTGFNGGIYNGPQFARHWVDDPAHGVPFLGSSSMLLADLSGLPLLRRRDAESSKLSYLRISPGTTLISCSGTIGRMVYTRPDMDGMWTSQDIMKVVPDPTRIPPGYLYAFLSSRYGVPLVTSSTYGAIIQHIEPHHLVDLPIPRLDPSVEAEAHRLVESAASARTEAAALVRRGIRVLIELLGLHDRTNDPISTSFSIFSLPISKLSRLDATYSAPAGRLASDELSRCSDVAIRLDEVARVFTPGIFKRRHVTDPTFGYPYYSGSELFQITPSPRGYLSKKAGDIEQYVVESDWILIQDAGQIGGLIGRAVRVTSSVAGGVVSNHLMRVAPFDRTTAGYLFAVLSSPHGYRAIIRNAFGSSIPQLDPKHVGAMLVPWPSDDTRGTIASPIVDSWDLRERADALEASAVALVEAAIEEAG